MRTTIIVFTGLPGTGKTTLSRQVAEALRVTLIAKDDIKEIMYDNIGWSDKTFSAKLAHATFGIMDYIAEQHIKNGISIMLESNYSPKLASKKFQDWQRTHDCEIIQIVCRTNITVLAERFADRERTDRHPGHNDPGTIEEYEESFRQRLKNGEDQPLDVKGPVRFIDTTDFGNVNAQEVAKWMSDHIPK